MSADLRESVLFSSLGLVVGVAVDVDFLLRERERERAMDCDCLVGESEMVLEEVVVDVGVCGLRLRVDVEGGLVGSGGGGNGRGWWRVETIVAVNYRSVARRIQIQTRSFAQGQCVRTESDCRLGR